MQPSQSSSSSSQILHLGNNASSASARLVLTLRASTNSSVVNIPVKANEMVQLITNNDLFTPEQKCFASNWESHFIQLLSHQNQLLPAKAVCFLGMKVITPALIQSAENGLGSDQLILLVRAQEELLTFLLPENVDVEGFVIQREERYSLMQETNRKLNDNIAMDKESEHLIVQSTNTKRETILSNANLAREQLRVQAQQWRTRITTINAQLSQLKEKADGMNQKLQNHSHELVEIGNQLAVEHHAYQSTFEEIKNLLNKV